MKNAAKKKVLKHLGRDIKEAKEHISEDRELKKSIKKKKK